MVIVALAVLLAIVLWLVGDGEDSYDSGESSKIRSGFDKLKACCGFR